MPPSNKSSRRNRALRRDIPGDSLSQTLTKGSARSSGNVIETISGSSLAEGIHQISSVDPISRIILDTVSDGIYCLDLAGLNTFVNPAAARMTGWDPADLLGKAQHDLVHHSHPDGTPYPCDLCPIYMALRDGQSHHREDEVFWRRDGSSFPVSYTSAPIFIDGVLTGAVVSFQDISERIRRERWQRAKHSIFHSITTHHPLRDTLQLLADAYTEYDPSCSIALLLLDDHVKKSLSLIASSHLPEELETQLASVDVGSGVSICGEAARSKNEIFTDKHHPAASALPYVEVAIPTIERCLALPIISASGQVRGVVAFFHGHSTDASQPHSLGPDTLHIPIEDIKHSTYRAVRDIAQIAIETRSLHSSLIHQSEHDHLTGLPNRLLFEDRLAVAIRALGLTQFRVAVCVIDIDRFRRVNENFGHLVGDELLRQISDRLQRTVRAIDTLARESGDEFLVLLPELASASDAEHICQRLLLAFTAPFVVRDHTIVVSANIGISICPDHAVTPELLLQNADTAVDFAKANGLGQLQIFRADLGQIVRQLAVREAALGTALERNELYLMYQPLYDSDRMVQGFEALLRWHNPDLGLIPPDQFIPLAESTGLIIPIGEWVLNEACRQAISWKTEALKATKIFVNISALQLGRSDFTHTVSEALRTTGLAPSRLELEVTESLIVPGFEKATASLEPLRELGVSIAIDDFGMGHSSFGVLHQLPINTIKVDRSFVSRIDRDPLGFSTVRAIIDLVRQLGMKTVGEGVETEEQFHLLREMKCDYFQGYLLSRPLTPEAAQLLFENVQSLTVPNSDSQALKISA